MGAPRRTGVVGQDALDLVQPERARRDIGLLALRGVRLALRGDRRGADGKRTVEEVGVRHAAHVPELKENAAVRAMDGIRHLAPTRLVRVGVHPGRVEPADARVRDRRRFGDEEARLEALRVVIRHEVVGRTVGLGSSARHRRHDEAVRKSQRADAERRKDGRRGHGKRLRGTAEDTEPERVRRVGADS